MAEYKVVDAEKLDADLSSVADAIREKGGTNESLEFPNGFVDGINAIESSGGEDDFIGVKYSNYALTPAHGYTLPKTADARSLDKVLIDPSTNSARVIAENGQCLYCMFANMSRNANGAYFGQIEDVYLPSKATHIVSTFQNCISLKNIHGDLSNIVTINGAFAYCTSLDINALLARMPNLKTIGNQTFDYCTQLTEVTLPSKITSIHTGAFRGCTNITKINCLFAEGTVTGAPWGATNADVVYITEV